MFEFPKMLQKRFTLFFFYLLLCGKSSHTQHITRSTFPQFFDCNFRQSPFEFVFLSHSFPSVEYPIDIW